MFYVIYIYLKYFICFTLYIHIFHIKYCIHLKYSYPLSGLNLNIMALNNGHYQ